MRLWLLVFGLLAISGCKDSHDYEEIGGGDDGPSVRLVTVSGVVQKGPFQSLNVSAYTLPEQTTDSDWQPLTNVSVTGDSYSVQAPENSTLLVEATGTYLDDISGEPITLTKPLQSITTVQTQPLSSNVNVATHLAASQFQQILDSSQSLIDISGTLESSEQLVVDALGMPEGTQLNELNLTDISAQSTITDPDLQLLLLSASISREIIETGGFTSFEYLTEQFGQAGSVEDVSDVLGVYSGTNAQLLYEDIVSGGIISDLPALAWEDPPVWDCQVGSGCFWFDNPSPTIYVSNRVVYEADGEAVISITLGQIPQEDVTVRVFTEDDSAIAPRDYVALDQVVTISSGSLSASLQLPIVLDSETEGDEKISLSIESQTAAYSPSQSTASVTVRDGAPTLSAGNATDLAIDGFCLRGIGVPGTIVTPQCVSNLPDSAPVELGAGGAATLKLSLEADCAVAQNCDPLSRDWLVDFRLVAENVGQVVSQADLASYRYPRGSVGTLADAADQRDLLLALDSVAAQTLMRDAFFNDWDVRLEAILQGQPVSIASLSTPTLIPIPETLIAGDRTANIVGNITLQPADFAGCTQGDVAILADYSFLEDNIFTGPGCIDITADAQGETQATLVEGSINMLGAAIEMPSEHLVLFSGVDNYPLAFGGPGLLVSGATSAFGQPVDQRLWVHAPGMPFIYRVSGGDLTPNGVTIHYDTIRYAMRPDYSPQDPRSAGAIKSNDIYYSGLDGQAGSFFLGVNGIEQTLNVSAGSGKTAFPSGNISWQGFAQTVTDGAFDQRASTSGAFSIKQATKCRSAGCKDENPVAYTFNLSQLAIDTSGFAMAGGTAANAVTPAWGAVSPSDYAYELPDDLPSGAAARVSLPGYRFAGGADTAVTNYLLAHLEDDTTLVDFVAHSAGTDDFVAGNYFPSGVTIGPEIYTDSNGQPDVGSGRDLSGNQVRIDNQVDVLNLPLSVGAKYVVRNAGMTGVFNVDDSALQAPLTFYGYPLSLDRFAIRLVDNQLDDFNWIDGNTEVAGDAGLDIYFSNLQIDCGGRFGEANVIYEACDAEDNNDNDIIDENCGQRLTSWRADTEVFAMSFRSAGASDTGSCDTGNQLLTLEHQVAMLSLNDPVGLEAQWNPAGELVHQDLSLQDSYRLDAVESGQEGFAVQSATGAFEVADVSSVDGGRYGWVALSPTTVGLPFWEAMSGDVRVANNLSLGDPVPEPTVVLGAGELQGLPQQTQWQTNDALQQAIIDDSQRDIDARYEWGNTGFGFQLPVYYTPYQFSDDNQSKFIGRRQEADLFVLEAGAGINFIEPVRTKLSFGASADIAKLKSISFQVDLDNPENLGKVDQLLLDLKIINTPVLEPTLSQVQDKVSILNRFANKGLDNAMRAALTESLERLGEAAAPITPTGEDPFITASAAMAQVKSLPQQVGGLLDDEVKAPIDSLLNDYRNDLAQSLDTLENSVEALSTGDPVPSQVYSSITQAQTLLTTIRGRADNISRQIQTPIEQARQIVNQISEPVQKLNDAVSRIESATLQAVDFIDSQCNTGPIAGAEAAGYLDQVFMNISTVKDLLGLVEGSELLVPLINVVASDPELNQQLNASQAELQRKAEQLLTYVNAAETEIRTQICSEDVDNVLLEVAQVLSDISDQGSQIGNAVTFIGIRLDSLLQLKSVIEDRILSPLSSLEQALITLDSDLREGLSDGLTGTSLIIGIDNVLLQATDGQIDVLVAENSSDRDVADFVFNLAQRELNNLYSGLRNEIVNELQDRLPGAFYTPQQLRQLLVAKIMSSAPVASLRVTMNEHFSEVNRRINEVMLQLTDQVNHTVKAAVAQVESEVNDALETALAPVRAIPLEAASMDGFAVIAGDELERAHIGAQWTMSPASQEEEPNTFGAALDAVSWSASNKTAGCSIPPGQSRLDVTVSAFNIPAKIASSELTLKKIYLGFTLAQGSGQYALAPKGVYGGINTLGEIGFSEFFIYDPAFAAGIGDIETYIGARAGALFSDIQAEVAFLVGRTCNQDILLELDPKVAKFIELPPSGFFGAYARGGASFPVFSIGCPLTIGVGADFGAWVLAGPPLTVGGLVGGGAYGKVACVGALRGQISALGQVNTDGDITFVGSGFGAAGLGFCEPASWTSKSRSRKDSWCGTGDASFSAGYQDGWQIFDISTGAIY